MKYVLDTNALREPLRPSPNADFIHRLTANDGRLGIASVVLHEALYGIERLAAGRKRRALTDYFHEAIAVLPVLPYDDRAALWHARERARLEKLGKTAAYADGQIAATAAVHGAIIVTANTRDFAHFEGVRTVDWLRPRGAMRR